MGLKVCSHRGCHELVTTQFCASHQKAKEQERVANRKATLGACDYGTTRWRRIREHYRTQLLQAGVTPACGARLPGARETNDSTCRQRGHLLGDDEHRRRTGKVLNVDHITPHEGNEALFLDPLNFQLLCEHDHNRKSQGERSR